MKPKQVSAVVFIGILLMVPFIMWTSGGFDELPQFDSNKLLSGEYITKAFSGEYALKLEKFVKEHFPMRNELSAMGWNIRFRTGSKEIDGYFITDDSIIKNVGSPNKRLVKNNNEVILKFAQDVDLPMCIMLIPTASAVKQQALPAFATPYNQKTFIEGVYQSFGGGLATVDAYPVLFANQEKSLFYNTEDGVAPLGGYYVYTALCPKLRIATNPMSRYTIEYAVHGYEGSLCKRFPYATDKKDVISLYHYRNDKISRNYMLCRTDGDRKISINDLYDRSALKGEAPLDVFFGGPYQTVDINVFSSTGKPPPNQTRLLIFGDETVKSYLPFLAPQYGEIKVVNAETVTAEQADEIDLLYYDQVLFAFSTDTYMHCENLEVLSVL
ncbi:MAG: DHHW family protein [Hydrogenoanaerobacterium sp.]